MKTMLIVVALILIFFHFSAHASDECHNFRPIAGDIDKSTFEKIYEINLTCVSKGSKTRMDINSPGGDTDHGLGSFDLLRETDGWNNLTIHAYGQVSSAATAIFMAGKTRLMACHSYLMIHEVRAELTGKWSIEQIASTAERIRSVNEMVVNVYHRVTGLSRERIRLMMKAETVLYPKEAVELGFATGTTTECK